VTVQSIIQNHVTCDVWLCQERCRYEGGPDDFWGQPGLPEGWTAVRLPKHARHLTHCPYHSRPNAICGARLGVKPGWMNNDQYDADCCRCDSLPNHEGECTCAHTRQGDVDGR